MPFYEDEKCPVCNKNFKDGDDIVTCPDCATPHHRECYNSLGHCFNADKHNTDFEFEYKNDKSEKSKNIIKEIKYYSPQSRKDAEQSEQSEEAENSQQQKSPFAINLNVTEDEYKDSKETVEGKSLSDIAAVVLTNTKKFIPKFLKNRKLSWNWSAFIFGPYYMFFRKMYKQGTIFMSLGLIANLVVQGIYMSQISELYSYLYSNIASSNEVPSQEVINEFMGLYNQALPAFLIIFAVTLIIHIVIALFADGIYRTKVLNILENFEQKTQDEMFRQNLALFEGESNLSQKDIRRLYLGKMGGTNIFAPALAFIILDLITNIISRL